MLRLARTIAAALLFGAVAAVVIAVIGAIMDLWMTGSGEESLTRPWIELGRVVALSRLDAVLLLVVSLAMIVGGRLAWRS